MYVIEARINQRALESPSPTRSCVTVVTTASTTPFGRVIVTSNRRRVLANSSFLNLEPMNVTATPTLLMVTQCPLDASERISLPLRGSLSASVIIAGKWALYRGARRRFAIVSVFVTGVLCTSPDKSKPLNSRPQLLQRNSAPPASRASMKRSPYPIWILALEHLGHCMVIFVLTIYRLTIVVRNWCHSRDLRLLRARRGLYRPTLANLEGDHL